MKRLKILLLSALCMLSSNAIIHAYNDVYEYDDYYYAVSRLSDMGVINGYEDGCFRPSDNVTREEFAKMVVCAIDKTSEANGMGSYTCKFSDVSNGSWAIPYINFISSNGIIKGYTDGSFGANNNINYAEASTILCKLLGYSEDSVGYYWPNNYVKKANSIGLNFGTSDIYTPLNRAQISKMLYATLFSDVNPNATDTSIFKYKKDSTLLESAGFTIVENCFVIASKTQDKSLLTDQVKTSSGTYKVRDFSILDKCGNLGTLILDSENKVYNFVPTDLYSMSVGISNISGNEIEYISSNGSKGSIRLDSGFETYVEYEKTTFASSKSHFELGTDLTFYGSTDGGWEFVVVETSSKIEPVIATKDYKSSYTSLEGISINKTNLTVYRDGKNATLDDIKTNDVVYYNTRINTMDVYSKKVSGTYYAALPSKAYITSVQVNGKEYTLGTLSATKMLDASNGAFDIGDKITLLLGKNDEVAFVKSVSGINTLDYGVLLSTSVKIKEVGDDAGKSEYIASILMSDGETYEYVTKLDYKDYKGDLVKIKEENSLTSLTSVKNSSDLYGEFDPNNYTLGTSSLSKDVVIFQRLSNYDNSPTEVNILDMKLLTKLNIDSGHSIGYIGISKVISYATDSSFGDVIVLYVEDFTDDGYEFGIMTSRDSGTISEGKDNDTKSSLSTYKIIKNGTKQNYTSSSILLTSSGNGPIKFKSSGTTITSILSLYSYASSTSYDAIDGTRIKIKGKVYSLSPNLTIYENKGNSNYSLISYSEFEKSNLSNIEIYSDKKKDGEIKMIVIKKK